ncbi:hypothetical protein [Spirosoma fluminis]
MAIQFSDQEIALLASYLQKIEAGENQSLGSTEASAEWNQLFLLLRKLLAYGVHAAVPTSSTESYTDLQTSTQKPNDMRVGVHAHYSLFERLLATYIANH